MIVLLLLNLLVSNGNAQQIESYLPHRQINYFPEEFRAPPFTQNFILPRHEVIPFNQWNENNGYCGEVSALQAGMNQGQWMSQFNSRLICGTGLSQSGPDGFCSSHGDYSNYNAQFLLENPRNGDQLFASAGLCLKNAHLSYELYDYSNQLPGMAGYRDYLSWVKKQMIAKNQVTIGILNHGGGDPQYDHEVTVTKIGTNHSVTDGSYYDDDVIYFEDHSHGGTPYTQGYTFQSIAKTRGDANGMGAHMYSILIPGAFPVLSSSGGDGVHPNPHGIIAANYGFAVSGPADRDHVTLPVVLTIKGSTTNGKPNSPDSVDGFNFETPSLPSDCTNSVPPAWMGLTLQARVSDLKVGTSYNLYEYDFDKVSGVGEAAALAIPDSSFNAHHSMASKVTHFVARETFYLKVINTTSDKVIAFRCVEASAP